MLRGEGRLRAEVVLDGRAYDRGYERIEYDHIPALTLFPPAEARLVLLDVQTAGERIGYLPGAGDQIPAALERMGYTVESLAATDLETGNLDRFDAIVLGIRALNTDKGVASRLPALFAYAEKGGVVIVQYNTTRGLLVEDIAPYPLRLSRERVTDETAEMRFLAPEHPVLRYPNRITPTDFEGWVQERGLYFADDWDPAFVPVVSANDAGEPPRDGSLLIAPYGEGWFVYTGLSWFRQLPAGVPGAYRLFANLVSLGQFEE